MLMIQHGENGAMGLVLNRAAPLTLRDLSKGQALIHPIPALVRERERVRGRACRTAARVHPSRLRECRSKRHEVLPGLYLSVTMDALGPLFPASESKDHKIRFCLGYAGWGAEAAREERSRQGAWLFHRGAQKDRVLEGQSRHELWDTTVQAAWAWIPRCCCLRRA